jgi:hypothetical protein
MQLLGTYGSVDTCTEAYGITGRILFFRPGGSSVNWNLDYLLTRLFSKTHGL